MSNQPTNAHIVSAYRAISSPELLELVFGLMEQCKQKLIATGKFSPHTTWPNFQAAVTVQIHLPIMQDRNLTVQVIGEEQPLGADTPAEDMVVTASIAESSENPPDLIRETAGLPVLATEISRGHGGFPAVKEVEIKRQPRKGQR